MTAGGSAGGDGRQDDPPSWGALFDRASECEVGLERVREAVAARRNA